MNKQQLKRKAYQNQNGHCNLSDAKLALNYELIDTHRTIPKKDGGTYLDNNYGVVNPIEHQKHHKTYKEREQDKTELKKTIDAREHAIRFKNKVENQLRAYKRQTDDLNEEVINMLIEDVKKAVEIQKGLDRSLTKQIKAIAKYDTVVNAMMSLKAVGPVTIAYCHVYIEFEQTRHPSSLWSYVGLDKPSYQRYEKGKAGGGNKRLRCVLYTMADSQIKQKGVYREIYDREKAKLAVSEKETQSRNTQGKLITCKWKNTKPSHRHGAAIRKMMKHFLADLWFVGRVVNGLETNPTYAEAQLGMNHRTIKPSERGWKY